MNKTISKIYESAKASRDANGVARISAKDIGKIVKAKLGEKFPKTKFSVKSDYNSLSISWEGLPMASEVNEIAGQYSFGGFDGSIDMAYDSDNWMLPDGSMVEACSSGTRGSMGYVPAVHTDCPAPGAILVKSPLKYISVDQDIPDSAWESAIRAVLADYGQQWDDSKKWYDQTLDNQWRICEHLRRYPEPLVKALS